MAVNIHNLIAAISPDVFCKDDDFVNDSGNSVKRRAAVKQILKTTNTSKYLKAAKIAVPVESKFMDIEKIMGVNKVTNLAGLKNPIQKHSLSYDSFNENLEPVYYWILDALYKDYKASKVDKVVDNFLASAGSGYFSEMGQRSKIMQEESMKMLGNANTVIKSILNIIYDLKEFKMRLKLYETLEKGSTEEKKSSILSLKQIWMDTVDIKRNTTSLKGLVQQLNYTTVIDAFMAAEDLQDVEKIDLNDRVKRIIQQRLGEFKEWLKESSQELRKRYNIERNYLKGQFNNLKLYARWIKPYLTAAKNLEQKASPTAALVHAFNTVLFELTLLAETDYNLAEEVDKGDLPKSFKKIKTRKYSPIMIIELKFRSIPERANQGYGFRGKLDVEFTSYALNDSELKILRREIEKDDVEDLLTYSIEPITQSMNDIAKEVEEFIDDKENIAEEEISEESQNKNDTNPISALLSIFKSSKKDSKKMNDDFVPKDSDVEKMARSQAIIKSRLECQKFYGLYKKVHNMPSF